MPAELSITFAAVDNFHSHKTANESQFVAKMPLITEYKLACKAGKGRGRRDTRGLGGAISEISEKENQQRRK